MSNEERIEKIETFIHGQRYLHGLLFHVLPDGDDKFIIEFAEATQRQLQSLNHKLREYEMSHIRCRAIKTIEFTPKHHGRKQRR